MVFLVISCPCALVISIPLGYFGGIGAASRKGLLFKGSNFLDLITEVDTVVMDKTGILTERVFKVQEVVTENIFEEQFLAMTAALENKSNHPIASAVVEHAGTTYKQLEVQGGRRNSGTWIKRNRRHLRTPGC